eukprot:4465629-Ditylum_brightwellii.AAC.2
MVKISFKYLSAVKIVPLRQTYYRKHNVICWNKYPMINLKSKAITNYKCGCHDVADGVADQMNWSVEEDLTLGGSCGVLSELTH